MLTVVERTWWRSVGRVMGCPVEVMIDGDRRLVPQAFHRLRALETVWSRFRRDSELNRLMAASGRWVPVSDDLLLALRWCARMRRETGGLFDAAVRPALERWGYDRTFAEIDAARRRPPRPRRVSDGPTFEIDAERQTARVADGVALDLGGIGKGLAADLVAQESVVAGARGAYVCLGGDIHFAGEPPPDGWPVPVLDPRTGAPVADHPLRGGGLVMSTVALRTWTCGGVAAHHIIDPRTGSPARTDVIAVAVAALSSARAEALAKAAIIAGEVDGLALLRRAGVAAWVITDRGVEIVDEPGPGMPS